MVDTRPKTSSEVVRNLSPGALVEVRGATWLIQAIDRPTFDGSPAVVRVSGTSELVRGMDCTFLTDLDEINLVRPEDTKLVRDESPNHRNGRLHIDAIARRTPVGASDAALRTVGRTLVDDLSYQQTPVHMALDMLRPRILIADAVGLGKTIEVAVLLNELAMRRAADRVLVVVPQAILEQVQHELWCRTGFPLVRLDTRGIQRMKSRIPSGRNPFAYFKRVIVSIDTIKQPGRYLPLLREVEWDVVWIDECHSLINRKSQNSELARVLATNSDGFVLTSATPHNGKPESFAELISLLDPTAIADRSDYEAEDIEHLFVRRHRHSPEVEAEVADSWAEREPPRVEPVTPKPSEEAIFAELTATWIQPVDGKVPCADRLFPWTLFKAACSSPAALLATVQGRLERRAGTEEMDGLEQTALLRLSKLAQQAVDEGPTAKFEALLEKLKELGVTKRKKGRAVIFSERVDTLDWLKEQFLASGRKEDEIVVFHNALGEQERQDRVKEFGLEDSKVRLFITGDMASEGVNLHKECHVLFHWDLPWSLIRIQQRNGRIDRYGQKNSPVITALVTMPEDPETSGDARIIANLLAKEDAAHRGLGDAAAVMGEWDEKTEEAAIKKTLASKQSAVERAKAVEEIVPTPGEGDWAWGGPLNEVLSTGTTGVPEVPRRKPERIFEDNMTFVGEIAQADERQAELEWRVEDELVTFVPPDDLKRRFDALPAELVNGLGFKKQIKITGDHALANTELVEASKRRQVDKELNPDKKAAAAWPEIGYLTDEHPVTSWAVDRALCLFGRGEAPVLVSSDVDVPVVLCVGTWSNQQGEPLAAQWIGIEVHPDGRLPEVVCPAGETFDWLAEIGAVKGLPNSSAAIDLEDLQALIPTATDVARQRLENSLSDLRDEAQADLDKTKARLNSWTANMESLAADEASPAKAKQIRNNADAVGRSTESLITNMTPGDAPHIQVVAVITGAVQ